jgi:hypothetical protein
MAAKYSAIYYPDCYVDTGRALTTYLLLYDELHLIAISDDARNPTERFRGLPDYTMVTNINKGRSQEFAVSRDEIRTSGEPGEIDDQTRRILSFYQFVQRYKPLLGDAVFFHPHVLSSALNRLTDNFLGGGIDLEEFANFLSGKDEDLRALTEFQAKYPSIRDEALWRIVPTAMKLAKDEDLVLVSDRVDIPVPVLSSKIASVRALTSILAEECISLLVPSCREVSAEDIIEVREALSDLLVPFRMSLQGLSKDLRDAIDSEEGAGNVSKEAKFIVEGKVEPALFELRQKIEKANSKLFNKVFGKVLSWIPFIAKAYTLPSPGNLLAVAKKVGGDSGALLDAVDDASFTRIHGLCFLLKAEEVLAEKKEGG